MALITGGLVVYQDSSKVEYDTDNMSGSKVGESTPILPVEGGTGDDIEIKTVP